MQIQNDCEPILISSTNKTDVNSDMEDETLQENLDLSNLTPSKKIRIDKSIYSGAFALSSPPEHLILSDQMNYDVELDEQTGQ